LDDFYTLRRSDNQIENPSIVPSHDGITWVTSNGLINPVVPTPSGLAGGYNSNPHLVADPNEKTLHLVYRECVTYSAPTNERLYLMFTTDGVNWSTPKLILGNDAAVSRPVSLAIVWDGKKYIMWYIDIKTSPKKIIIRTSSSLDGT
jgi:hypothetical protein